jgi:hypothetical protein
LRNKEKLFPNQMKKINKSHGMENEYIQRNYYTLHYPPYLNPAEVGASVATSNFMPIGSIIIS